MARPIPPEAPVINAARSAIPSPLLDDGASLPANMPPMRAPRKAMGLFCLLSCGAALLSGCGGGSDSGSQVNTQAEAGKSRPAPPKSDFPATEGRTLKTFLTQVAEVQPSGKITPSAEAFYPGPNRYPF